MTNIENIEQSIQQVKADLEKTMELEKQLNLKIKKLNIQPNEQYRQEALALLNSEERELIEQIEKDKAPQAEAKVARARRMNRAIRV